ncbi:hypothetical protein KIN20_014197 [Parelaphostrongylus tenuis]|uniref:Uncharacterized protein n=1 Tax=Parelaphostrongylus tenuis TaxID=148309 RepID=A0AAD5QP42_PARTN|nr:hypothetical protein KIN20_014197 [Parelaphostrongylus tenuis]
MSYNAFSASLPFVAGNRLQWNIFDFAHFRCRKTVIDETYGSHKQHQFKIKHAQKITAYPPHGVSRRRSLTNMKLALNGKCAAPYDAKSLFDKQSSHNLHLEHVGTWFLKGLL